ncbi:MAG: hypothetical protein ACRBFS_13330 [Aureispira sp.]
MKYLFLLLFFGGLFNSCGTGEESRSPEQTCEAFMTKLAAKEYDKAKKFTSRETDPYLDLLTKGAEIFSRMNQEGNNFQAITTVKDANKLAYTCTTTERTATCNCAHQEDNTLSFSFELIQENGQWVIHQPKETSVE